MFFGHVCSIDNNPSLLLVDYLEQTKALVHTNCSSSNEMVYEHIRHDEDASKKPCLISIEDVIEKSIYFRSSNSTKHSFRFPIHTHSSWTDLAFLVLFFISEHSNKFQCIDIYWYYSVKGWFSLIFVSKYIQERRTCLLPLNKILIGDVRNIWMNFMTGCDDSSHDDSDYPCFTSQPRCSCRCFP